MTDTEKRHGNDPAGETRSAQAPQTVIDENGESVIEAAKVESLLTELDDARAKADENWDRLVRMSAEVENVRKRAERDVETARKYALEKFATELLAVRDSLEMGLASVREADSNDKHVEGMQLTLKLLEGVMGKFGIEPVDPTGEPFNPEYHEAMSTRTSAKHAPNTVVQTLQTGYLLNDRLLRPAMVIVTKAP